MKKNITILALCAFTCSAFAAETKEQLAEKLLGKLMFEERFNQGTSNMLWGMLYGQSKSPDMQPKLDQIRKRVTELAKRDCASMKLKMIHLYTEIYTDEEMKAAIAFYETPSGETFAKKHFEVLAQSGEIGMEQSRKTSREISAIIQEELHPVAARANAIEKTVINDARQVASAAQQFMAENATDKAPLSEVRKFLSGEKLSKGIKIGLFDPKNPGEVQLFDIGSKEGGALVMTNGSAFVLGHDELDAPSSSKLKGNASTTKGTAAFTVESGQPLTK